MNIKSMKSVIPVLFSLLLIAGQIEAQDSSRRKGPRGDFKIKVIGQLLDSNSDAPLAYATISIFNAKDDVLVGGGLTGDDGSFDVETKPGKLYAIAEYISYEALRIDDIPFEKGKKVVDLGNIYMVTDAVALSTVEIRAEKSETQFGA